MERAKTFPEATSDDLEELPKVGDPVRHGDDDVPAPVNLDDEALEINDADQEDDPRRW